jgi:hypothetical protein
MSIQAISSPIQSTGLLSTANAPVQSKITTPFPSKVTGLLDQNLTQNLAQDRLDFKTQNQLFAAGVGFTAAAISLTAAYKLATFGSTIAGTKGAIAGALVGGLATASLFGAGTATVSDPIFYNPGSVVLGGTLAGATLGLYKGGVKGAFMGAGLGAALGAVAQASAK